MMMEREPGGFRPTVRANFFPRLLLVFAGLSLLSVLYTYSRPVNLQLTMDMASSQAGVAQLFYDTGRAFNEADSSTCRVDASSPASFEHLSFSLPEKTILRLRFDPLTSAGRVVIRNVQIRNKKAVLENIPVSRIMPFNQIAERTERRDEVEFVTVPGANDPGVILGLAKPLRLRWVFAGQNLLRLGVINACLAALCVLIALTKPQLTPGWRRLLLFARRVNRLFERAANRFPRGSFLAMDATAFWIYAGLIVFFCLACLLDLNGSSSALYGTVYGNGPAAKPWIGTPKDVRVDEWAYVTPDILNQYYRADRFEAKRSVLGDHFVALTGNVPVRDVSTFFRPQFWAFFALPLDYAYSVYWQAKALLLVAGVFTFLLWLTRSTRWALAGALWYFFSPFIQWSYSWPSALPEMIGSLCLGTTCFCYLTVGRKSGWLALAAVAMVLCGVNFAMCAYLPHMIPLLWVAVAIVTAWCGASVAEIAHREGRWLRVAAVLLSVAVLSAVGLSVYGELKPAIIAVADTLYPGRRVVPGGTLGIWKFASHLLPWGETEKQFPAVLGNICEGSGFLWLAPVTLLCIPRLSLTRFQKAGLAALWCCFFMIFCWCAFPMPAAFGRITGLDRSTGSRCLPALGLINVAIVALSAARFREKLPVNHRTGAGQAVYWLCAAAIFLAVFRAANGHLDGYFTLADMALAALFLGLLAMLLISGKERLLALLLVIPQALLFGTVNPVERGLPVFTRSQLHSFIQSRPQLLAGRWLMYSGTPIRSGFLAAEGCEVYTGTRYLPDIDHFALFAARGMDLNTFNRLGYLDATPIPAGEPTRFIQLGPVVVNWEVAATDPLVRELGIRYVAFDFKPTEVLTRGLAAVSDGPVDGLWLYRVLSAKSGGE
jgi:hypothetical protein